MELIDFIPLKEQLILLYKFDRPIGVVSLIFSENKTKVDIKWTCDNLSGLFATDSHSQQKGKGDWIMIEMVS